MARVTVEDCLTKVHNRFALVLLVAKRAKQLMRGSQATLGAKNNKNVVVALREVATGHVFFDVDESQGNPEVQIVRDLNR